MQLKNKDFLKINTVVFSKTLLFKIGTIWKA